jgi:hypothetical protein
MVELIINKKVNFLMMLYEIAKNQNKFEHLSLNIFSKINETDRKNIKTMLRSMQDISKSLNENKKLSKIYNDNLGIWEKYWRENFLILKNIRKELIKRMNLFEMKKLKKLEYFFETKKPKNIKIYVCMGNNYLYGTGNSFSPNLIFIFPRKFGNSNKESLDKDFAMMIHELVHLYQQDLCMKDKKEFVELVARAFAPRGVFLNRELVDEDSTEGKFTKMIEDAIKKNKTYLEVENELMKVYLGK